MVMHCIHELFMLRSRNVERKIYLEHTEQIITCYNRLQAIGVNVYAVKECAFTGEELSELTEKLESLVSSSRTGWHGVSKSRID